MKLVSRKTPATISNIKPKVPVIILVKNKMAITAAIIMRIILSAEPMFFFIIFKIIFNLKQI
jgi:hypothetical protein